MKAKELMDKNFVYLNCDDTVVEVSKVMEEIRRFTCPVVNGNKQLVGWITSFDITKGLREGNDKISEILDILVERQENIEQLIKQISSVSGAIVELQKLESTLNKITNSK